MFVPHVVSPRNSTAEVNSKYCNCHVIGAIHGSQCQCRRDYYVRKGSDWSQDCAPCPLGATCAGGIAAPIASSGYYSSDVKDDVFLKCPSEDACSGNSTCAVGYKGMNICVIVDDRLSMLTV